MTGVAFAARRLSQSGLLGKNGNKEVRRTGKGNNFVSAGILDEFDCVIRLPIVRIKCVHRTVLGWNGDASSAGLYHPNHTRVLASRVCFELEPPMLRIG